MAVGLHKINSLVISSIAKVNSLAKASIAKINSVAHLLFADAYAVSKSISEGVGEAVNIEDTDGNFNFRQSDTFSFSIWVRAGWSSSLNTNIHFWAMNDASSNNGNQKLKLLYNESNNGMQLSYGHDASNHHKNEWLFHSNTGNYAAAYAAAGLGAAYWSASNRGNVGDDNFTMITITYGGGASAASSNLKLYWNATDCGIGLYASGSHTGTPNMSTADRRLTVGSAAHHYKKSGNSAETVFNDFTIWNAELTSGEVSELYNSGTRLNATTHSQASALVGYYQFESDGVDTSGQSAPAFGVNGDSNIAAV